MALFRALETTYTEKDKLFDDPYAIEFLDRELRLAVRASSVPFLRKFVVQRIKRKIPGAFSSGLARTKYIDDLLEDSIKAGIKQVLILGAGFDTRAQRLPWLKSLHVIEIDHPNTSDFKKEIFKKQIGELPSNVKYYQVDFNEQSLEQLALKHNFDFSIPTAIIWEGVTNYLTAGAIDQTFSFMSKYAKGTFVIFTYVHKQVLDNPELFFGAEKLLRDLGRIEEHWTFGFRPEDLDTYLKKFGLTIIEDLGATEYRQQYLPLGTEKGYEFYRVAMAKKQ